MISDFVLEFSSELIQGIEREMQNCKHDDGVLYEDYKLISRLKQFTSLDIEI